MRTLMKVGLLFAGLVAAVLAHGQEAGSNLAFEQGSPGQSPPGWIVPQPSIDAGYVVQISTDSPKEGKQCASMELVQAKGAAFGNMMQTVDASPFRGKRVRFRAAVRFSAGTGFGRAQLWLRVDRPGGQPGFFNNMGDRPITSPTWAYYDIVGDVADDAETVNFGMLMAGSGKAWIDAASLRGTDAKKPNVVKARALTDRGLQNLIAYSKLFGYIRHFHPSDAVEKADWNAYAIAGVLAVEDASDPADLARRLQKFFEPLAPTINVFVTGSSPGPVAISKPTAGQVKIVSWENVGFGGGTIPPNQNVYHSRRVFVDAPTGQASGATALLGKPFQADLGGGVSCRVPTALYAVGSSALPHTPDPTITADAGDLSGDDRTTRIADVVIAWNVYEHFYPYFDAVQTDWPAVLSASLTAAATDADEHAFLSTLRRLVASAKDGHGNVNHSSDEDFAMPPVLANWVEGKLVVIQVGPDVTEMRAGNEIVAIDGQPVDELWKSKEVFIAGATEQWRRYRGVTDLLRGRPGSTIAFQVKSDSGQPFTVSLKRALGVNVIEKRPRAIEEIKPGIWYVDLDGSRANMDDYKKAIHDLAGAQGIVFDMRGYPNEVAMDVLQRVSTKPVTSALWNIPKVPKPDHQGMDFITSRWPFMGPLVPRFRGKIAFVTDGRAISYAESVMGIVEYYKLGEIVGEPTAGTNGNINPFSLPGGYTVIFTGMKVLKHDGSTHHGIGISPTIPVHRTIAGVAAHRDEMLEKAIAAVSG